MVALPLSPEPLEGGSWRRWAGSRGAFGVLLTCPGCGYEAFLDHDVAPDGSVSPSVVCPMDCGFHDFVRLEDWDEQ